VGPHEEIMSNGIYDLRSLPLADIIGAPLNAMVQAEAQAARTTLEFIERVGFTRDPQAPPGDMGQLRLVEFTYQKPDVTGQPVDFVVKVPLLALLPLPGVKIKNASVSFTAKITDVYTEKTQEATASAFDRPPLQLRGGFTSSASKQTSQQTSGSYDLSIKLEVEHVAISSGLEKLHNVLEMAIADLRKDSPE
jgi:hypothetical protein